MRERPDVAVILRRARTEGTRARAGSPRWGFAAVIAAVMVALVLGAGAKLLGGMRDVTPLSQPDGQVTYVPGAETTFQPVSAVTAVPEINIGANEAVAIAETYIHQAIDGTVDLRDAALYAISCVHREQVETQAVSLANVYEVTFSALDEYGTAYTVYVQADDGGVAHCESQRGVGVGHTAEEIRAGYGRIWGTDMAQWTWTQLFSYRSALRSADLDTLRWTDVLMRNNSMPDPSTAAITAETAAQASLAAMEAQGVHGTAEATAFLRDGAQRVWRVTIAQEVGADGMEWVHFVEVDESGSVSSHTRVDRANAQMLSFISASTFQSNMQTTENSSIPSLSDDAVLQAAEAHIRERYGETQDVNDPALYTCQDANSLAYATIERYLVYEPVDPEGTTYWVCVDWYGGIVDSGAGRSHDGVVDIDLLRMQAVDGVPYRPHENEPDFYLANGVPYADGYYYSELFSLQALLRESGDLADPVAQLFLNTEYVMGDYDENSGEVHKALGLKHCNTSSIHIRKGDDVIERLSIESEKGCFLVEYSIGLQEVTSVVQVKDCYDPWYAPFLLQADMESAGVAPEAYVLPSETADGAALTAQEAGVVRGMRISHLNDRYRALYGLNLADWTQEQLRSWQQMAIITESVGDDLGVLCLRNTYYPDVPIGAIGREIAAQIGAQALGLRAGYTMDGAVLIGTDGDPVWKVCLYGALQTDPNADEGYWYAEVNCMTGEVTAIRQRLPHGAWEMPYYGAESVEYWFRDVVLEETIEECEQVWDCKSNG